MDSMSGCDIRLVFTFPPKDSTVQYKNDYTSEITFLALVPCAYTPFSKLMSKLLVNIHALQNCIIVILIMLNATVKVLL